MDEERGGAGSAQEGQAGGMGEKLEESYVRTEGAILLLYSTFVDWYYRIYHFLLLQSTAPPEIMTERMGVLKKNELPKLHTPVECHSCPSDDYLNRIGGKL